ncbi:MAG TPA: M6 family metalloprotease domain-containing protein [Gemmatimonadales bacterium]|nr:M6 family metalloprotease domain-containing protein [Gemmatimonadales bacterium]
MTRRSLVFIAVLSALTVPTVTRAQQTPPPRVRREIPGFDFRKDGVWRRQARAVRAVRARLLSRRNFGALNAPMAAAGAPLASGAAVSGVLRVPAILFKFKDTPAAQLRTTTQYNQVLFAASPTGASAGRPYTYRSYYEQLSNGLLSVQGQTYGYAALDSNEVTYTGGSNCAGNPYGSSNCNGLFDNSDLVSPVTRMQNGLREALRKLDNQVDWTQYDADGDSVVDLVVFIQPALDGACGGPTNNHLWAHRFVLTGTSYATHSRDALGRRIVVSDYTLQSGVGGEDGCDTTQVMPVGTVAHETGHGFGLPDLYDTDNASEGVGEFSLMGSGNYTTGASPSRMDTWSLNELGWVTVVPIPTGGTYAFGPAPTSDTAFYLPVGGANPRGEYFLLENRQAVQSDSAMIRFHCVQISGASMPPCGGGLLIYHVDSAQIVAGVTTPGPNDDFNHVNVGPIHGLAIVQADGRGNLDADPNAACSGAGPGCSDRGDAGDLYPGPTGNVAFTPTSAPAAVRNSDGSAAGPVLDQITQLVPNGTMQFHLSYPVWVVRATDSAAVIQFDGLTYHVFRDVLTPSTVHSVSVADTQYTAGGRTRHVFLSWAPPHSRTFSYTTSATPETLTVTLARSQQVHYTATSGGTITGSVPSDTFVTEGTQVTLTAADTSALRTFQGWAGDTVTKNLSITLPMSRPYGVRAVFLETFSTAQVVAQLLNGSSTLTVAQLGDLDQLGNNNNGFDLGDFLAWVQATGAPLTAEQRALVSALKRTGVSR